MGLLDLDKVINNDAFQLGAGILGNNTGHYGAFGPAFQGGLNQYNATKQAEYKRLLEQQKAQLQAEQFKQQQQLYNQQQADRNATMQATGGIPLDLYKYQNPQINPTDFDRKLELYKRDPESYMRMYGKKNQRITVGPDGSIDISEGYDSLQAPTKSVTTKSQEDVLGAMDNLNRLTQVASDYKDDYLTYYGQAKGAVGKVMDKAGLASDDQKNYLAGKTKFQNGVEQFFNSYRKEITGAAASVQELDRLKKSLLNTDMSPTEFNAALDQFIGIAKSQLAMKEKLLKQGYIPDSKEYIDAPNKALPSASVPSNQQGGIKFMGFE